MNDFTKEELEHIATLFKFVEVSYPTYTLDENLWIKIESMIDNHCEHQWSVYSDARDYIKCSKCETIISFN